MAAIVQAYSGESSFSDPINITITAVTSGNDVVFAFRLPNSEQPVVGVSLNSGGGSGTLLASAENRDSSADIFYYLFENVTVGSTQISVDTTGSTVISYAAWEISGLDANPYIGAIARTTGTSTAPSASFTSTTENECVLGFVDLSNSATFSTNNGYTARQCGTPPTFDAGVDNIDIGASGSKTIDITLSDSRAWCISGVRLRNVNDVVVLMGQSCC